MAEHTPGPWEVVKGDKVHRSEPIPKGAKATGADA